MIRCGECGMEIQEGEVHNHLPDFFLSVWNCRATLMRSVITKEAIKSEPLPFSLPDEWVDYVLESCGGAINMSGIYRLPGMVWEWVVAKLRGDDEGARFIADRINEHLSRQSL